MADNIQAFIHERLRRTDAKLDKVIEL